MSAMSAFLDRQRIVLEDHAKAQQCAAEEAEQARRDRVARALRHTTTLAGRQRERNERAAAERQQRRHERALLEAQVTGYAMQPEGLERMRRSGRQL